MSFNWLNNIKEVAMSKAADAAKYMAEQAQKQQEEGQQSEEEYYDEEEEEEDKEDGDGEVQIPVGKKGKGNVEQEPYRD